MDDETNQAARMSSRFDRCSPERKKGSTREDAADSKIRSRAKPGNLVHRPQCGQTFILSWNRVLLREEGFIFSFHNPYSPFCAKTAVS
jgi:hypothetical protein